MPDEYVTVFLTMTMVGFLKKINADLLNGVTSSSKSAAVLWQ
jgi:hypothetical protein